MPHTADSIDYKTLYFSLFNRISRLANEISEQNSPADTKAEEIILKLCNIMLDTEEQYLTLSE